MPVHISSSLEHDLEELAALSNSTADELAQQALERYVAFHRSLGEAVERADEDIRVGRVLTQEALIARIEERLRTK